MNNTFSLKRFGAYLAYDIRNAKNNYLLSLIILGVSPMLFFIVYQLFAIVITGSFGPDTFIFAPFAGFVAVMVAILTFPTKQYGAITEKKAGSSWLMLPASTLEKTLSMIVVTCLVLPLALGVIFLATDGVLSLLFPDNYGYSIIHNFNRLMDEFVKVTEGQIYFNVGAVSVLDWCESILIFTLGAIVFKKSKAAKTILALLIFGMVMSNLSVLVLGGSHIDFERIIDSNFNDLESFQIFMNKMNVFLNFVYVAIFGVLIGGIYYRLRTIQQ